MIVGVVKESFPGERRVALVPTAVPALTKAGLAVQIEAGAGLPAGFDDAEYLQRGAQVIAGRDAVLAQADVLVQVRGAGGNPTEGFKDLERLRQDTTLIGLWEPLTAREAVLAAATRGLTVHALELIPRITRAQSMDVLSSMATLVGYRAALIAAEHLPRIFPMMITAAGTLIPAKVLILGAGVAGLQAIATSRRLGAVVSAYDVREAVRLEVQSLGAKFVELDLPAPQAEVSGGYAKSMDDEFYRRQRELLGLVIAGQDVVITTAAVPGKKAPILLTAAMVRGMRRGSVIVDVAAERGGNCELTRPGEIVEDQGIKIVGPLNLPSTLPHDASQMFARNISTLLLYLWKEGKLSVDTADEIVRGTLVTHAGDVCHPQVAAALGVAPAGAVGSKER